MFRASGSRVAKMQLAIPNLLLIVVANGTDRCTPANARRARCNAVGWCGGEQLQLERFRSFTTLVGNDFDRDADPVRSGRNEDSLFLEMDIVSPGICTARDRRDVGVDRMEERLVVANYQIEVGGATLPVTSFGHGRILQVQEYGVASDLAWR